MPKQPIYHPQFPEVEIKRQNRKTLAMRVTPSGDVVVMIPTWIKPTHPQVKRFIRDGLRRLDAHIPETRPEPLHDQTSMRRMVDAWATKIGVRPTRVQFRAMTRKWGSCSTKGSVTLNTALCYVPGHLVEYVIVHELIHMLVFDHGPAFWQKLSEYLPDYAVRERELDTYKV